LHADRKAFFKSVYGRIGLKHIVKLGCVNMKGSNFFNRVYEIVSQIPEGKVATYGQIAAMLGSPRAARIVGEAMRRTPEYLDIPCHRVISKDGTMAPGYAFGGEGKQREMLEKEGVIFKENGCVDMQRCLWRKPIMERDE